MSKEIEKIKNIVAIHFGALGFLNPSENKQILKDRDKVLNVLTELQAIKNAEPSEAMKQVKWFKEQNFYDEIGQHYGFMKKRCDIIEKALLKAEKLEKAWNIAVEKQVDIRALTYYKTVEEYNEYISKQLATRVLPKLTQEEFDLLKRMIEND